jgi:hypothetical protein
MIPIASGDKSLMRHSQDYRIRKEEGKKIEEAVACCEKWIKENLCNDVEIREDQNPPTAY